MRQPGASLNVGTLKETVPTTEVQTAISATLTITGNSFTAPNKTMISQTGPWVKFAFKSLS
jgi:hypothetical protein